MALEVLAKNDNGYTTKIPGTAIFVRDKNTGIARILYDYEFIGGTIDKTYYSVNEIINSDTDYILKGRNMQIFTDKPCSLIMNDIANSAIPLYANIILLVNDFQIDSIHLVSVLENTKVNIIIKGA